MHIPLKIIPQEIIDAYKLTALVDDQAWVYMRIEEGMYGLKKSGIIANQELVKHMAPFGYHPVQHTPGLWVYDIRKTLFILVVENFCVKYCSIEDANHFFKSLISKYLVTVDMAATFYIRIKLEWDYLHRTVTLSMPIYLRKALQIF